MSEKEKYAQRVMGRKCANCGDWIVAPVSIAADAPKYDPCVCGNPQTALEKAFAGVTVAKYKMPGGA